ncbi:MAG: gliding motility-associated C-terminal domain-containing protein [Bacteroidota bacterium]
MLFVKKNNFSIVCFRKFWLCYLFSLVVISSSVNAQSVGGTTTGATTYCTNLNSGIVTVSGFNGTILNWQSTTNGGSNWNAIANTTVNQTYFNLNQTTCYRAIVQDGAFPTDTSTVVCITIYPASVGGTISGGGSFCDNSGAGSLILNGSSGPIQYWETSTDNGNAWTTVANTTNTESYTSITQNTLYRAVVQSNPACPTDTSAQAAFVVDPTTVAGTVNGSATVCETANSGTLTLTGSVGSVLGWQSSINNGINWAAITNTTSTQSYFNISQTTEYRAIVKSGVCATDTSDSTLITVSPASSAGVISGGGTYCGTPATGTLSLTGSTGNVVSWASSTNNGVTWTTILNTSTTQAYSNLSATTYYIAIVQSGACAVDTSAIEIVNVAPQTVAGSVSGNATACAGVTIDTLVLNGNVGAVTGWISSTNNGLTWNAIANTTSTLVYNGLIQTTTYAAIVQSGLCAIDTTASFILIVVPLPGVNAGNDVSINQGESTVLNGVGAGTPMWLPITGLNNPGTLLPIASPTSTTAYVLTITDVNNCANTDTVIVTVLQNIFDGKVSNLFTPNGDGVNDSWYVEGIENFPDNEIVVFNMYGNEVFKQQAYLNDWKGTFNGAELPDGTYYYVIRFESANVTFKGSVDILRSK